MEESVARAPSRPARIHQVRAPSLSIRGKQIAAFNNVPALSGATILAPGVPALDRFPLENWRRLINRSWRVFGADLLFSPDPAGWLPLRRAIAAYLGPARGVRCDADQIVVVSSSREAAYLAARIVADPGDRAWIEEPGYIDARASLIGAGLKLVPVRVDSDGIDVDAGIAAAADARIAYVTPSNQFPLGMTMSLARRLQLLGWATRTGAYIIEDDYDGEFRYAGRPLTALQGLDDRGRVIYMGTFSKIMFPSLRLAYVVCPPELVEAFRAARRQIDGHPPSISQAAMTEFIESGLFGSHIRQMRMLYDSRRVALLELLADHLPELASVSGLQAGIHLVAYLPRGINDSAVVAGIQDRDVKPLPLSRYYLKAPSRGLVIGYGSSDIRELRRGVDALAIAYAGARMSRRA